ncbi:MAG: hypothetical protein PF517_15185 [Salinivirgaceae bacterium]|jgi:hypothetical protein|nr:hypothetical protein [Salinivirgaceae bacterium]
MMKWINKVAGLFFILSVMLVIPQMSVQGQVAVSVKMDTSMLLIGDQTNVVFEASFPESAMVSMPVFSDTIIDKLEIINIANTDTIRENKSVLIRQKYLVTSFDSGWYEIPPVQFVVGFLSENRMDTLQSNSVYFGVMTMPIDTANADAITDIKVPIDAPITFKEVLPFAGIGLGVLLLAFLAYILYLKLTKKEPIFVKKEKPKEPAHIVAFRDLEALKEAKLWQKGQVKEYYSRLTEVVRVYIEDRYDILAMESTTDEIIDAFRLGRELDRELKDDLFDTLVLADFVKFAKASPMADENEKSMLFAYNFISKTKVVEVLRDEDEVDETESKSISEGKNE